jgi:hypothetical protein
MMASNPVLLQLETVIELNALLASRQSGWLYPKFIVRRLFVTFDQLPLFWSWPSSMPPVSSQYLQFSHTFSLFILFSTYIKKMGWLPRSHPNQKGGKWRCVSTLHRPDIIFGT